jgi:catechol 2,3-dioxygenase-like lactoylglutathione lyase family enzyme
MVTTAGIKYLESISNKCNLGGVDLDRPFKIRRVGSVNPFIEDYEPSKQWYERIAGFTLTEEVEWQREHCAFLRCDNEHHYFGIFSQIMAQKLGLSEATSNMSLGLQLVNYQQLKAALSFLRENGVRVETDIIPADLHPGIDYVAYAFDPDGHCLELYYYMERVGCDNGSERDVPQSRSE